MKNLNVFKRMAVSKIAVIIKNPNQEKEFKHLCKEYGICIPVRDITGYGKGKTPLYPIYFSFYEVPKKKIFADWDVTDKPYKEKKYLFFEYKIFKKNILMEEKK